MAIPGLLACLTTTRFTPIRYWMILASGAATGKRCAGHATFCFSGGSLASQMLGVGSRGGSRLSSGHHVEGRHGLPDEIAEMAVCLIGATTSTAKADGFDIEDGEAEVRSKAILRQRRSEESKHFTPAVRPWAGTSEAA